MGHDYAATITWQRGQGPGTVDYRSYSRDYMVEIAGKPVMAGSADRTFRGSADRHNPEDMLVIALSACHMLSYLAEAARAGLVVLDYRDAATGHMNTHERTGEFTEVVLHPVVTVAAGSDLALAAHLHETAHGLCFIARSVNFPVRHVARTDVAA